MCIVLRIAQSLMDNFNDLSPIAYSFYYRFSMRKYMGLYLPSYHGYTLVKYNSAPKGFSKNSRRAVLKNTWISKSNTTKVRQMPAQVPTSTGSKKNNRLHSSTFPSVCPIRIVQTYLRFHSAILPIAFVADIVSYSNC